MNPFVYLNAVQRGLVVRFCKSISGSNSYFPRVLVEELPLGIQLHLYAEDKQGNVTDEPFWEPISVQVAVELAIGIKHIFDKEFRDR